MRTNEIIIEHKEQNETKKTSRAIDCTDRTSAVGELNETYELLLRAAFKRAI